MREKKEGEREKRKGEGKRGEKRKHYNLEVVELLLSRGSDINGKDYYGSTPLHLAAANDRRDGVAFLLKQTDVEVNPRDEDGRTPLHVACWRGNLHTVELLLGHNGIDANVVDNNGDTPLHVAVRGQRYNIVSKMLSKDSVQLDIKNHQKVTPLQLAVSIGHLEMVHQLIAKGADVNVVNNEGNNCLHLAVKSRRRFHSEVEPLSILDKFCKDLKLGNEERCSGVVVACYLAHHGANFYCKNKIGRTPLDLIEKENFKKTLNMLFRPTQCRYCHENMATVRLQPCDLVLCENCSSEMTFKRCPVCRGYTLSKSEFVIVLGVDTTELKIDDESIVTVKQGYLMLNEWFKNCDPETRTHATLRAALEEAECIAAMECLSLDAK
ncbi:E3 ubiquitin-protein ligase MIB2-like isoform X1 [Octopus vulgaris]|uniref:E3 ubiquitin-protein ligase MIB2-like isoform X1 n=1 Tax=Octopus vulgaris TaxID=6645 RepID=A0AA36HHJ3_OCTVU|nr:E3 ubiquitin-protein ligase MIB2-like isoform X1 [Octopus vulgaris]